MEPSPRVRISTRFLLGIYAIVPICLVVMLVDRFFNGGSLAGNLPNSPEAFLLFQLLFGTPHIIASSVILFTNGEYMRAFWPRLVLFSLIVGVLFAIALSFFLAGSDEQRVMVANTVLAVVGAATVLHVIKQQVGIGKGICRLSSWVYDAWGWTLIVFGSILYYALYSAVGFSPEVAFWVYGLVWGLGTLAFGLTVACSLRIRTVKGQLYLWLNAIMVLQSALFFAEGYTFLAILGPRLVHDLTAFTFYIAHDINRHGTRPQNTLYWLASRLGVGVFWVCPVVAVGLTYLISVYFDPVMNFVLEPTLGYTLPYKLSFLFVGYLGLLHYYTEVFTWKHGSPYRQHLTITA